MAAAAGGRAYSRPMVIPPGYSDAMSDEAAIAAYVAGGFDPETAAAFVRVLRYGCPGLGPVD